MRKASFILGLLSLLLIVGGSIARSQHLPGGSVSLVLGAGGLFYLFLLMNLIRSILADKGALNVITQLVMAFAMGISMMGGLFLVQYYPGAKFMAGLGISALIPALILAWFNNGREGARESDFFKAFPLIVFFASVLMMAFSYKLTPRWTTESMSRQGAYLELLDDEWKGLNDRFTKQVRTEEGKALERIESSADSVCAHIDSLKWHLVEQTLEARNPDKMSVDDLKRPSDIASGNYDVPTLELGLSTPTRPEKGKWTAHELKTKLEGFQDRVATVLKELDPEFSKEELKRLALQGDELEGDPKTLDPAATTWEGEHFYHMSLTQTINTLTILQSRVRASVTAVALALDAKRAKR